MRYYCNICKKDITKDEFLYSIDRFDKPLCREHQKTSRPITSEKPAQQIEEPRSEKSQVVFKENATTKPTVGGLIKKAVVVAGKGFIKGVKTIADEASKRNQIASWKNQILRRMSYRLLKQFCRERDIATKRTDSEMVPDDNIVGFKYKDRTYNCSFDELVDNISGRVSLDDIISFAKRNHINIRDILQDIDVKKAEWEIKKLSEQEEDTSSLLLKEIEKNIWEFSPLRKYWEEILYQDTLATYLKSKFPDKVVIERQKGSSRPDIVVDGVAIEIKGPTNKNGLISIADKCMRYKIHYPKGLIIVLFNVDVNDVNDYYYREWVEGLKRTHPGVIVIRKQ